MGNAVHVLNYIEMKKLIAENKKRLQDKSNIPSAEDVTNIDDTNIVNDDEKLKAGLNGKSNGN